MSEPHPVLLPQLEPAPGGLVLFSPAQWRWITGSLRAIYLAQDITLRALGPLTEGTETIMATVAELQTSLDALTAADAENAQRTSDELAQLAAAIAAIPVGEPVTQAQLDQVNAVVAAMQARNAALAGDDAPAL